MPLIIGGGPAGAAAAIHLARNGWSPVIVERNSAQADPLCGGFLSWNSIGLAQTCGVDPFNLGGHVVRRARLFAGGKVAEWRLPAPGVGLSRKQLDAALLERSSAAGATIIRGIAVRSLKGGAVHFADGSVHTPEHLIVATGKHDLRGIGRPVTSNDPALGLRWRFAASKRLRDTLSGAIELHLFRHGYAGLILQEDGMANLCLAVRRSAFVEAGQNTQKLLTKLLGDQPSLSSRLSDEAIDDAQAIANIPYGWRASGDSGAFYRVGDQIGVIPSLAGEGIAIALTTGIAAAKAILEGVDANSYQRTTSRQIAKPVAVAEAIWRIAEQPALARCALVPMARLPGVAKLAMRMTRVRTVNAQP